LVDPVRCGYLGRIGKFGIGYQSPGFHRDCQRHFCTYMPFIIALVLLSKIPALILIFGIDVGADYN
jgi:hypothetical protein